MKTATKVQQIRNIGISAHIDSGKTTLTERILLYGGKIEETHEVRGKDGVGATMDFNKAEKERGITIESATTYIDWKKHRINIIDTPGHVDFTIEVERALRVLDGAIFVLCSVGGVQSQSLTVARQMNRYQVPGIAFINKCDRAGADPLNVCQQLRDKLDYNAHMIQLPIGLESSHRGVIDLISMKAYFFEGKSGREIRQENIPTKQMAESQQARDKMLEALSLFDDDLADDFIEENQISEERIIQVMSSATIARKFVPVCVGSALANKGVQLLMDKVCDLLPNPEQKSYQAFIQTEEGECSMDLIPDPKEPLVMLAFKLEEQKFGQLTHCRIYQGHVKKGDFIVNSSNGKRHKVGRLVQMHANKMLEMQHAEAGMLIALFGIDCASGDTFTNGGSKVTMNSMFVPEPVMQIAVELETSEDQNLFSKAVGRFMKEDPTFKAHIDSESGQTIISGMGELHLEVYLDKMKSEYEINLRTGAPQVAYRETITRQAEFVHTYKKQNGGKGHYAKVIGYIKPALDGTHFTFINDISNGSIPKEYHNACEKGFVREMHSGRLLGFPITGVIACVNDGDAHKVDSSDMAFSNATGEAFQLAYSRAKPQLIEPIMKVVVETPSEFTGSVIGALNKRRGLIVGTQLQQGATLVEANVPLAELFGFSGALRSSTKGTAEFTMELHQYNPVPVKIQEELLSQKTVIV